MLAKLSALITSKVALAALGGTLVVGGAATVATETGHMPENVPVLGPISAQHHDNQGGNGQSGDQGHHGHTIAIQGTLTSFDGHTLTVTGKAQDQGNSDDGDSHDANDDHGGVTAAGGTTSTSSGGTSTASKPCTFTSPFSITVDSNTKINGQAKTLDDLKSDSGHSVQVQATADAQCSTLTAWKVTVAGPGDGNGNGNGSGNGSGNGNGNGSDHPGNTQGKVVVGTVGTVGGSGFTLQPEHGGAVTVNVTTSTRFSGVKDLSGIAQGMRAGVLGTQQSDGTVTATLVAVMLTGDGHGAAGQGHNAEIGGTVASVDTTGDSFVVTTEENQSVTVHVTPATIFAGDAHDLSGLQAGMRVAVGGTQQSDGSLQASQVAAQASDH